MTRLTNIITSVLLLGLIVSGIGIYLGGLATTYGNEYDEDGFTQEFMNRSRSTSAIIEEAEQKMLLVEEDSGVLDRLASFFRGGYDAAKGLFRAFTDVRFIISHSLNKLPFLGGFGSILITTLTSIALVIVVVGILLHFLIKSDRT